MFAKNVDSLTLTLYLIFPLDVFSCFISSHSDAYTIYSSLISFFILTSFHLVLVCSSRISRRNSFQNVYVSKPKLMSNHFQNTQTSVIFPFWVVLFPRLNANIGESLELFEASNCINSRCSFSYHSSVGLKLRFRCYKK